MPGIRNGDIRKERANYLREESEKKLAKVCVKNFREDKIKNRHL
jgi:hypothetical protein